MSSPYPGQPCTCCASGSEPCNAELGAGGRAAAVQSDFTELLISHGRKRNKTFDADSVQMVKVVEREYFRKNKNTFNLFKFHRVMNRYQTLHL